jgi:hypothetical protein
LLTVDQFWSMTPYEITVVCNGHVDRECQRQRERQEDIITQAWHTAAWASFTKKLPDLNKLLQDIQKPQLKPPPPSDEDLIAEAKRMNLKGPW